MPHINWKSVSYIINFYLTQWTDNRMPDKRGMDNRGSTVLIYITNKNQQIKIYIYSASGTYVLYP